MVIWIVAGYIVTAAAFYSYIVATAKEEPVDHAAKRVDMNDWQKSSVRGADDVKRKAA